MKRMNLIVGRGILIVIMLGFIIKESKGEVFDIKIREFDTGILLTNKVFSWSNISVLTNGWKLAREYVEIDYLTNHSVITGWGLQIYTHNRTNIANPKYTGTMDNPGGMIALINSNNLISLAWAIKFTNDTISPPVESTPGVLSGGWHWMLDKSSSDFTNEKEYIVAWNQGGIAWSDAVRQHKPLKAYLYIAAKFENLISSVFRTSQLRIEEYSDTNAKFLNEFYIYKDGWYDTNPQPVHYIPALSGSGTLDDHWTNNVHSGNECIKITLTSYSTVWAGWHWLEPQNNWTNGGKEWGYDLTGATKLTFWARGENGGEHVCFKMGDSHDSCGVVKVDGSDMYGYINLTSSWTKYQITLTGKDLSYVHVGFLCGIWSAGTTSVTFYLDDIKYEK